VRERVLASVTVRTSGCWEFNKKTVVDGYGRIKIGGRLVMAHRAAYEAFRGPIRDELLACHSCDNRLCCNPWHIFPGTDSDNMRDAVGKGRARQPDLRGTRHPKARLTDEDVRTIRACVAAGQPQHSVAHSFGISQSMVSLINLGRKWSHVS
jgi:hypothetical protein